MRVYDCCDLIRLRYVQIGSGEQGYVPEAIHCALSALNCIAANANLPDEVR